MVSKLWSCWGQTILLFMSVAAANPVQDVFTELFGQVAANATSRATLLSHLDTLLALGASQPGEKLLHVHEYADSRARQLGTSVVPSLEANNLDTWVDRVGTIVAKLDETQSFSMVRRLVVASLLRFWLKGGDRLPDASAHKTQALLVKLYEKHRLGAIHKGVMEYLHVSKSGGTSWCHIAEMNGCTTERYDKSYVCQIKKFDDKVRWLNITYHMLQVPVYKVPKYVLKRFSRYGTFRKNHDAAACGARSRYVAAHGYNYYSNEYTVHGGHKGMDNAHMCGSFFNAIVMRDPLKRLVSHMKFVMWTMSGDRGYNDTLLFNRMYANRTSVFWQELGPAMVDNYFIRSLLGEKAFHVPVGSVNKEMLELAEHVLAQFDLIMVLEQEQAVRNLILYYGLGWRHTLEEVHDKNSDVREAEFNTTQYIPADVNRLLEAQTMDLELYKFARMLAQLDPVVYEVARKAGVEPLPNVTGDSGNLHCGMLRGQNKTGLLAGLGFKDVPKSQQQGRGLAGGTLEGAKSGGKAGTRPSEEAGEGAVGVDTQLGLGAGEEADGVLDRGRALLSAAAARLRGSLPLVQLRWRWR